MKDVVKDDGPAFAPTLHSILDRYKVSAVDRLNAVKSLSAITLALVPEELFDSEWEGRLDEWFGERLDRYRDAADEAAEAIGDEVIAFVWAAAQGDPEARQRLSEAGL